MLKYQLQEWSLKTSGELLKTNLLLSSKHELYELRSEPGRRLCTAALCVL